MDVINRLTVQRRRGQESPASIELLLGDLSAIPPEHAVDALVVSAFPDSYTPNPGTLFRDLYNRGLNMQQVAEAKQEDQRERLGCWISRPLAPEVVRKFNFSRIVCFEPRYPAFLANTGFNERSIEHTVGYAFRCLNNFVIPDSSQGDKARGFEIKRIAMPLLATGNQQVPVQALLPSLLEAAVFWLENGLPIECLKIVAFKQPEAQVASRVFYARASSGSSLPVVSTRALPAPKPQWETDLAGTIATQMIGTCTTRLREQLLALATDDERSVVQALFQRLAETRPVEESSNGTAQIDTARQGCDVFVSYSHKQDSEVLAFVTELKVLDPSLAVFFDRESIPPGAQWLKVISNAVHEARVFVAMLSPDYSASPVCWDEFQCAKLKEYNTGASVILTARLYSEPALPPIMGIHSYCDCAEGDLSKLRAFAATLRSSTPLRKT